MIPFNPTLTVFTAGPIQGAPDWQSEAAELFKRKSEHLPGCPDFCVANPRSPDPWHGDYEGQVRWEVEHLYRAGRHGVVMFWLAKPDPNGVHPEGRAYGQTSRFELGEWFGRGLHEPALPYGPRNLVVGIEPGFSNERYIRTRIKWQWSLMEVPDNLDDTVQQVFWKMRSFGDPGESQRG